LCTVSPFARNKRKGHLVTGQKILVRMAPRSPRVFITSAFLVRCRAFHRWPHPSYLQARRWIHHCAAGSTAAADPSSLAFIVTVSGSRAPGRRHRDLWVNDLGVLFLHWCRPRVEGSGSSPPRALGRCSFQLAAGSGPCANGSDRHVLLRRLCRCRPPALRPIRVEVAAGVEEPGVHWV
jgi:hypothetical protein